MKKIYSITFEYEAESLDDAIMDFSNDDYVSDYYYLKGQFVEKRKPDIDQLRTKLKNTGNLLGIDVTLLTAEDNNATTNNQESEVTQ